MIRFVWTVACGLIAGALIFAAGRFEWRPDVACLVGIHVGMCLTGATAILALVKGAR